MAHSSEPYTSGSSRTLRQPCAMIRRALLAEPSRLRASTKQEKSN